MVVLVRDMLHNLSSDSLGVLLPAGTEDPGGGSLAYHLQNFILRFRV